MDTKKVMLIFVKHTSPAREVEHTVTRCKVSVVITNYNKEKYVSQCLQSVIAQTLREIEIIVIDDGSTDQSLGIIQQFAKQDNRISVYVQENAGVSAARNAGIRHATGEYVTFLDADDYVAPKAYEQLYNCAKKGKADTAVGNILCFNEYKTWNLSYMKQVFQKKLPAVRHITTHPELHLTPSASNKLFRRELIIESSIQFDETLRVGEDLLFTQECFLLSERTAVADIDFLHYRVLENEESLSKQTSIHYFEQLVQLQVKINNLYERLHMLAYLHPLEQRQWKFFVDSIVLKGSYLRKDELSLLVELGNTLLASLKQKEDLNLPNSRSLLLTEIIHKRDAKGLSLFLELIHDETINKEMVREQQQYYAWFYRYFREYKDVLVIKAFQMNHRIEVIELRGSVLKLGGYAFIEGMSASGIQKELVFTRNKRVKTIPLTNALRTDITYVFSNNTINYNDAGFETIEIEVADMLEAGEWQVTLRLQSEDVTVEAPMKVVLMQLRNNTKPQFQGKREIRTRYPNQELHISIQSLTALQKLRRKLGTVKRACRSTLGLLKRRQYHAFWAILLYTFVGAYWKQKQIWLIGERKDTAQDNSYHLFRYIREHHPKVPIYYVIDQNAKDYGNIADLGQSVQFGSFRHTWYLLICAKTINSYIETTNMYTDAYKAILKLYPEWQTNEKIFIQHGVIGVSRVNQFLHKNRRGYSLFVVSSEFEKNHVVKEFGYSEEEVIVTGLARWDALEDESKGNEILLMPTWRSWIQTKEQLEESVYWKTYMSFLQNEKLHHLLEERDWTLTFFPHYQMQKLSFDTPAFHERIKIVKQGEETVQSLLKRHRLLLTDYSTVSFDFAYMDKPVIFYQFDYDEFYSKHYNEGPIDHKKDLFGSVVLREEDMLHALLRGMEEKKLQKPFLEKRSRYLTKSHSSHCRDLFYIIKQIRRSK